MDLNYRMAVNVAKGRASLIDLGDEYNDFYRKMRQSDYKKVYILIPTSFLIKKLHRYCMGQDSSSAHSGIVGIAH